MNKGKSVEAEKILRQSLDMKRTACPDKKNSIAISELLSCSVMCSESVTLWYSTEVANVINEATS